MGKTAEAYRAQGRVEAYKAAYKALRDDIVNFAASVNAPIELSEFDNYYHALEELERAIGKRERRNVAHRLGLLI